MIIELCEEEVQEIVKALETVRKLHEARSLPVHGLNVLINQLRLKLPCSGVMLRPKPKGDGEQAKPA